MIQETSIHDDFTDLGQTLEAVYTETGDAEQAAAMRRSLDRMDELFARLESKFGSPAEEVSR